MTVQNKTGNKNVKATVLIAILIFAISILNGCGEKAGISSNEFTSTVEQSESGISESDLSESIDHSMSETSTIDEAESVEESFDTSLINIPETYPVYELSSDTVKLMGRNYSLDGNLWCALSGSGAEFTFYGEKLDLTFLTDNARSYDGSRARVAVYIDEERVLDQLLSKQTETFTVYEGAKKAINVRIVKLSEAAHSSFGIAPITVSDGEYVIPVEERKYKIEFIGDSITCGYGVDDEDRNHHFSTATEDATKAWAYKTAQKLNADYSIFSYSGWGIISGYTSNSSQKSASQLVPSIYDKLAFSYQKFAGEISPQSIDWDFAMFQPDAIVINLGTNDASYCDTTDKKEEFTEAYTEFLKQIRKNNPDAYIFCALGTMGNTMYVPIKNAVEAYSAETGDTQVEPLALLQQSDADGIAADWHPTEKTHEKTANAVAYRIRSVLGWE